MEFLIKDSTTKKATAVLVILMMIAVVLTAQIGEAKEDRALSLPFFQEQKRKECQVKKKYLYLTGSQLQSANQQLGQSSSQQIVKRYRLDCGGKRSWVFLLNDKIRTHYQTLLIQVVEERIARADVVAFSEPRKYRTPKKWYQVKIEGRTKNQISSVDAISGATLTMKSNKKLLNRAIYFSQLQPL
ncbi:MAG: FMN-binding protein [Bdellovibrionales bacterium]|jgi:hypothetical protein|nr:FMN-binding protein [Bdellovibrionales bacterium]MBT3527414.1 FMN-binding protein [Bdellovibrionales bacterium]MBT7669675.1 FMN-binding protein [Bdellovibrionales bacterium]